MIDIGVYRLLYTTFPLTLAQGRPSASGHFHIVSSSMTYRRIMLALKITGWMFMQDEKTSSDWEPSITAAKRLQHG